MNVGLTAVIGTALLVIWVAFLYEGREEMRRYERVSHDFLFKWNVLPLLVALELFTTQNLLVLGVGALLFFLCWPIAKFALVTAPVLTGWHVGTEWFSRMYAQQDHQVFMGAVLVAGVMTIVSQAIVAAIRRPPAH